MNALLDTNIVIAFLKNEPVIVRKTASLKRMNISIITVGELFYGARNSTKQAENLSVFRNFFEECFILHITEKTAEAYAEIRASLKKKGTPIPENDIWIAATAKAGGYTLISRDIHLMKIGKSIRLETW